MESSFFIDNREKFFNRMCSNTVAILTAGECVISTADECYGFEVDRNFYYLTGIDFPGVKLIIEKYDGNERQLLYVPYKDENKEKWTGVIPSREDFSKISGISLEYIFYFDEFEEYLDALPLNEAIVGVYLSYQQVEQYVPDTSSNILYYEVCDRVQNAEILSLSEIITDLRKVKSEDEISAIKKSAKITNEALNCIIKCLKPGMKEYEIKALFDYVVHKNGCNLAFETIVASGINATILHYVDSGKTIGEKDLLLIDCGAAKERYNSDVTRTYPVSGKFTDEQKIYYDIVLEANKTVIDSIKPGETLYSLNEKVKNVYYGRLKAIGLINSYEDISKYYYHSVSHSLGLDTHDVFDRNDVLTPGMVITVEPGLYIKELSLGIRIEDDVVVTEDGCIVLTDFIPKEIAEIEALMAQS